MFRVFLLLQTAERPIPFSQVQSNRLHSTDPGLVRSRTWYSSSNRNPPRIETEGIDLVTENPSSRCVAARKRRQLGIAIVVIATIALLPLKAEAKMREIGKKSSE